VWFRRAIIDPLWLPLAAVLAALFLLVAAAGALAWPVSRRHRVPRLALFGLLYMVLNVGLLLGCTALWLRHPVAARRDDERWQAAHVGLLRRALGAIRSAATPLIGFTMLLEEPPGDGELSNGPVLVLARHAGPGDSFALVDLLMSRYHRRPRIVLKQSLQWDPGLDVLLNRLSSCFLPSRSGAGDDRSERMADLAVSLRGSDAMLVFPEGGNWTPRRYRRALARLRRQAHRQADRQVAADAAASPNVLPPRPAGVLACLAARPDLDVVVAAHTGLEDLVSPALVWRALPLAGRPMTVRWWRVAARTIPSQPEEQYQWLRVQWAIVDSWIDARKAHAAETDLPADPDLSAERDLPAERDLAAELDDAGTGPDDRDVGPVLS
jgi:1-acyl-sn-glycerol-3-phosphate acyltransferase